MDIRKYSWAKALALFMALTVIALFSITTPAFADKPERNDVKVIVHAKDTNVGGTITVMTTLSGITYTAITNTTNGKTYTGLFIGGLGGYTAVLPMDDTSLYDNDQAKPLDIERIVITANGTVNIWEKGAVEVPTFDLTLTKIADKSSINVGESVLFTINVTNTSTATAESVFVDDVWPAELSQGIATPEAGNYNYETNVWTIGSISAGDTITLTIVGTGVEAGEAINSASVDFDGTDLDRTNNSEFAKVIVLDQTNPCYDLSLSKIADKEVTPINGTVTYSIVVTNNGPTSVSGVFVTEEWPAGMTISSVVAPLGTTFAGTTWEIGDMDSLEQKTLIINAVAITTSEGIVNRATVSFGGIDSDPDNNSRSVSVEVTDNGQPPVDKYDVGVYKSVSTTEILIGGAATFTITATNNGTTTINGIQVEDLWPDGLSQGAVTVPDGTNFTNIEGAYIWNVNSLGPKETKSLLISFTGTSLGSITNNVEIINLDYQDENLNNNTSSAIISIVNPSTPGTPTTTTVSHKKTTPTLITDPEVPLAEPTVVTPIAVIPEDPAPLADVPQTSDADNIWLLLGFMAASGLGLGILGRRKETATK